MDKIWLQSYQEGVPAEIELSEFQSLGEMFEKSVSLYRERGRQLGIACSRSERHALCGTPIPAAPALLLR